MTKKVKVVDFIIKQIEERNFDKILSSFGYGMDRYGLATKGLFTIVESEGAAYDSMYGRVKGVLKPEDEPRFIVIPTTKSWGFLGLKSKKYVHITRDYTVISALVPQADHDRLYDAIMEGIQYWDREVGGPMIAAYRAAREEEIWMSM